MVKVICLINETFSQRYFSSHSTCCFSANFPNERTLPFTQTFVLGEKMEWEIGKKSYGTIKQGKYKRKKQTFSVVILNCLGVNVKMIFVFFFSSDRFMTIYGKWNLFNASFATSRKKYSNKNRMMTSGTTEFTRATIIEIDAAPTKNNNCDDNDDNHCNSLK